MAYRKFTATSIFTGTGLAPENTVLITHEDGEIEEIVERADAGDDVEILDGMLTPGFVNAHCHLELSHMRNKIPPGTGLVEFLIRVIKERGADDNKIMEAMLSAQDEMYRSGTVAVADTCNTAVSVGIKAESPLKWRNFIEVIGFSETQAARRLEDAERTLQIFLNPGHSQSSLTPHAPYSVSKALFELINRRSAAERISIHNQESMTEDDLYQHGSGNMFSLYRSLNIDPGFFMAPGTSSVEAYLPLLDKASGVILVHNTYITEMDIRRILSNAGEQEIFFCACPSANKYIESQAPPISLLRSNNATIVLGTDSYASNWQLNIFEEIRLLNSTFPDVPLSEILQWATINGAKALEMEKEIGSFEKGKKPGLVLLGDVKNNIISPDATASRIL